MKKKFSFAPLSECRERIISDAKASGLDAELLCDVISSFSDCSLEVALSLLPDAAAVRIYDGEKYVFLSPVGLTDPWDIKSALSLIRDYAVAEMIPLYFTDVMREELSYYTELFRFVDARAYEDDEDLFFLIVSNECDALAELPVGASGRVVLHEIDARDKENYRRLCEDKELNRYWGYDVSDDAPNADAEYHLSVAKREFDTGAAITLGVYLDGVFIGEGVLYDFDMSGGASVAFRLLPEFHGRGLGEDTLSALIGVGREIGLLYLTAEVAAENIPSSKTTGKLMNFVFECGGVLHYRLSL